MITILVLVPIQARYKYGMWLRTAWSGPCPVICHEWASVDGITSWWAQVRETGPYWWETYEALMTTFHSCTVISKRYVGSSGVSTWVKWLQVATTISCSSGMHETQSLSLSSQTIKQQSKQSVGILISEEYWRREEALLTGAFDSGTHRLWVLSTTWTLAARFATYCSARILPSLCPPTVTLWTK